MRSLLPGFFVGFAAGWAAQQWRRRNDVAEIDRQRLEGEAESERLRLRLAAVQDRPAPSADAPTATPGAGVESGGSAAPGPADGEPTAIGTAGARRRDDLQQIKGIGPVMERSLNELGIESWEQIAGLTPADVERLTAAISAFPGRIERDDWVGSARRLIGAGQAAEAQPR